MNSQPKGTKKIHNPTAEKDGNFVVMGFIIFVRLNEQDSYGDNFQKRA